MGEPGRETWEFHPAPAHTFRRLKELVPPVLYIVGAHSPISPPLANQRKLALTPIAEMTSVDGAGHLVPLEKPLETGLFLPLHPHTSTYLCMHLWSLDSGWLIRGFSEGCGSLFAEAV